MGKGAALKLALPEPNLSGAAISSRSQACTGCSPDDEIGRGLDDFEFNCLDYDLSESDVFDDPFSEAHGGGQLFDMPFCDPPLRDAPDCFGSNFQTATSYRPPFGSLAVDALFKSSSPATAAAVTDVPTLGFQSVVPAILDSASLLNCATSLLGSAPSPLQDGSNGTPWTFPVHSPMSTPLPPLQGGSGIAPHPQCVRIPGTLQTSAARFAAKTLPQQVLWQQQQPLSPLAVLHPPVTNRRVGNRCEIATAFAAPQVDEVVLICSQAPKRKAEDDAGSEESQTASSHNSTSADGSSTVYDDVTEELIAPSLPSIHEVEELLPSIPTQQETAEGCIVYILPTLWRSHHPPHRIHVSLGLNSMRAPSAEAPATYYGSLNPRVVTTGVSRQPCAGMLHRSTEALPLVQTRTSRKTKGQSSRTAESDSREPHGTAAPCSRDPDLLEVWLLQRSLDTVGAGGVMNSHHLAGTQCESATITGRNGPQWERGMWAVDIVAKVSAATGQTFWLKAVNRAVQECEC